MSDDHENGSHALMHDSFHRLVKGQVIVESDEVDDGKLRRTVSAAYYAVFHRLIHESSLAMFPSNSLPDNFLRGRVSRAFPHVGMADACNVFYKSDGSKTFKKPLETLLRPICSNSGANPKDIAKLFSELQALRLDADYDEDFNPTNEKALLAIDKMDRAFSLIISEKRDNEAGFRLFVLALATTAIKNPPGG